MQNKNPVGKFIYGNLTLPVHTLLSFSRVLLPSFPVSPVGDCVTGNFFGCV